MSDASGQLAPGRYCPSAYRYAPSVFDRAPELETETLYVVGGLYGNVEALDAVLAMADRERPAPSIVFNGDFHWFDVADEDFKRISGEVARHVAIRGNVETEIATDHGSAGCGCAYPAEVDDSDVDRSNRILMRLRETAGRFPTLREPLARLPMHLVARVGAARIGVVHGDCTSLAGWRFAHDALDAASNAGWLGHAFAEARVDAFASSHTCLPALRTFRFARGRAVVVNNGAAGMPNFAQTRFGLLTRISMHRATNALYGTNVAGAHVHAIAVRYDANAWERRFLASWPEHSPAHQSYFRRIAQGPAFALQDAARRAA